MIARLAIVGAGGHGREVLDIAEAMREEGAELMVEGFFDDGVSMENRRLVAKRGYEILGSVGDLHAREGRVVVIGIGSGSARADIDSTLSARGVNFAVLVHPTATVGRETTLGDGVVLFAGARVTTNVSLARHVHINQNATVAHDCSVAAYATLNPLCAVSGEVKVGRGVLVGAGATVLQGLALGDHAVVGAGSCVVKDVEGSSTVVGVPAKELLA